VARLLTVDYKKCVLSLTDDMMIVVQNLTNIYLLTISKMHYLLAFVVSKCD